MGADPFASSDDGGLSGVMGQSASAGSSGGGGADLFARSARSPFAGSSDDEEPISNGHSSPHVSAAESMTGQRNENSVLFSLSNLQALATGSGGAPATPNKSKAGMAQGEGSGLIDIRALASATQAVSSGASNGSSRDKVEDLMSVGAAGTGFSAAALAAPVAVEKSDNSKLMMGGMAGAILLLGAAVGYLVLRSPPPADPMAQAPVAAQPALGAALPTAAAAAVAPTPVAPTAPEPAAAAAAEAPSRGSDDEGSKEERAERSRKRGGGSSSSGDAPAAAAKPEKTAEAAPAPAAPAKQSSSDSSIDDLLNGALNGKPKAKPAAAAPAESMAATPSRDEVMGAMKAVTPKVTACGDGSGGVAKAKVTVAGATGRVTSVEVDGPSQSCVTKEVSKAKFPKFSNSSFSFTYPFKL